MPIVSVDKIRYPAAAVASQTKMHYCGRKGCKTVEIVGPIVLVTVLIKTTPAAKQFRRVKNIDRQIGIGCTPQQQPAAKGQLGHGFWMQHHVQD